MDTLFWIILAYAVPEFIGTYGDECETRHMMCEDYATCLAAAAPSIDFFEVTVGPWPERGCQPAPWFTYDVRIEWKD